MTPDELKNERVRRNLSVRKAGPVLKLSWQYLTKLENGKERISDDRAELILMRYYAYDAAQQAERRREAV